MRRRAGFFAIVFALLSLGLQPLEATAAEPAAPAAPTARPPVPTVTTSATPTTRLFVKTVPQGAHVTLDGTPLGPSDGLFIVPPGTARVRVEFENSEPQERVVEIAAGRITRLELDFATSGMARPPIAMPQPITLEEARRRLGPGPMTPDEARLRLGRAYAAPVTIPQQPAGGDAVAARDIDRPATVGPWLAAGRVLRVPPPSPRGGEMPTASEIDAALLRPLPEHLVFDGVPLGDALKQLGRLGEVRLSIDEPALHKHGVDLDAAITARPGGVPLGDALSEIVRTKQLRWLPDDGGIVVTTRDSAKEPIDRPYRVDDLLDLILGDFNLGFDLARGRLAVTPWGRNIFATAYYPVDDLLAAGHTFDSLREAIATGVVAMPRPWVPAAFADARWEGGLIWVIEGGVNCLAITQTTAGHRAVEKILRQLRTAAQP